MKIFIEGVDVESVRRSVDDYPIDGVILQTTVGLDELRKFRNTFGEEFELHIPLEILRAEELVDEARKLADELGSNTYVGITVGAEGCKAMKLLEPSEVSFTATSIGSTMQALMAGKCGASYVMPFVNRLDNRSAVGDVKAMHEALQRNGFETEIIAARFRTASQAAELSAYGVGALSVSTEMLLTLLDNER